MATTTNYGWTTPDNTALVKDGASAIRTLGSSIDTTLKAQIDAQIPDTLLTTTGDVIYASAANTPARLGIGTTGQVLQVSGGLPAWGTAPSGGMTLISTTTLTGASITLSSIPQTYLNLYVVIRNFLPSTDSENTRVRVNSDSGTRYTDSSGAFSNTYWSTGGTNDNAVTQSYIQMNIWDYTNTVTWKTASSLSFTNNATTPTNVAAQNTPTQVYNQTGAITSLTFFPGAGNFTSGTVLLYGVK
jgi:hypothetical protein